MSAIGFCEVLLRLPFGLSLARFMKLIVKAKLALSSKRISDTWKEKILPVYAAQILYNSTLVFVIVLAALSPFSALHLIAVSLNVELLAFASTFYGLLFVTSVGLAYMKIRGIRVG